VAKEDLLVQEDIKHLMRRKGVNQESKEGAKSVEI